jgi:hypothetical protein
LLININCRHYEIIWKKCNISMVAFAGHQTLLVACLHPLLSPLPIKYLCVLNNYSIKNLKQKSRDLSKS